jgi:hypothetical protein
LIARLPSTPRARAFHLTPRAIALFSLAACATLVHAQTSFTFVDPAGDASIHRTDSGNDGPLTAASLASPHDLLSVTLSPWTAPDPKDARFEGSAVPWQCGSVHLFRLDVLIAGLANPPGDLGFSSGIPNPTEFGPNPLYGFIELDLDANINTGGELGPSATTRPLANLARFATTPAPSTGLGPRAAISSCDFDNNCATGPAFERSGADFTLALCGCGCFGLEEGDTNSNGIFDPGEVWILDGQFLQRAGGFRLASAAKSQCSLPLGFYEPKVEVRFTYNQAQNTTLVSLVFAIDQIGAGLLDDADPQPLNANAGDQASIHEGLWEVANYEGQVSDPCTILLTQGWWSFKNKDACQFPLNPLEWKVRALIGTGYASLALGEPPYVWTDTGFGETPGDLTGDGLVDAADEAFIQQAIASLDGKSLCPPDADGLTNGTVVLPGFASTFHRADTNYDGVIGSPAPACPADCDASGTLNIDDFICFQTLFVLGDPAADCDASGTLNIDDFICFQTLFVLGC